MDFETSCWSGGSLPNAGQTVYNFDNPVQRRQKVDYFDSTTFTPIVSHISSNGYYGYCPTISNASSVGSSVEQKADIDCDMNDMAHQTVQSTHEGRKIFENRKRAVEFDEFTQQDTKRRRSQLPACDYAEGLYTDILSIFI